MKQLITYYIVNFTLKIELKIARTFRHRVCLAQSAPKNSIQGLAPITISEIFTETGVEYAENYTVLQEGIF
jgi:hypothetical protein